MAELLPCPFCGEEEIYAEISYLAKEFRIYCASGNCTAEMRLSFEDAGLGEGGTIDFAEMQTIMQQMIDLWNTHSKRKRCRKVKKTYCDICKKEIEFPKYKFLIRTDNGCTINTIASIMDGIEYDLCDECKENIMAYTNDIRRSLSENHMEDGNMCDG